jgi:hypothetical protein
LSGFVVILDYYLLNEIVLRSLTNH